MEILLEKKDNTNATLKVNLKEADYQPKIKEKLKEYGKKASLKGFRPGKIPASVLDKMYGKSILVDEINNMLYESVNNYIKENKLQIVGDPLPDSEKASAIDWENQKEFEFIYNLGLVSEFTLELSDKISVTKYNIKVEDDVVKETSDNLRSQYGQMTDAESVSDIDYVKGDLKESAGTFTTETLLPMNKVAKNELPKFLGKKVGDKVEFNIEEAFNEPSYIEHITGLKGEEANKKGKFEFTISNIRHAELAELNQEFFDKIFGKDNVKSEEEFNAKLKETIQENYKRESEALLTRDIEDYFIDNVKIELPNDFLKRWLLVTNQGKVTQEQIDKEYDYYAKELKWTLIKNKVAENNEIKVDHQDVLNKTKEMFMQQFGMSSITDEMQEIMDKMADNYLKEEKGKNYMKLFEQVYGEKTIELIKSKIKTVEKDVTVDEFKNAAKVL